MRLSARASAVRPGAVAGAFYPAEPRALLALVDELLARAARDRAAEPPPVGRLLGLLAPHAGLVYSGAVAAAAWRLLAPTPPATIVLLGTVHFAGWLEGVGAWEAGAWETPLGDVEVDERLAGAIVELGGPYAVDRAAHLGEHSLEVQLPFLRRVAPEARIVPLAIAIGTGAPARAAGERLGTLLRGRLEAGERILLAISTDAAHYPGEAVARMVNERLRPALEAVDAADLAERERALLAERRPGLACGMCGIQPAVLGLAALRAMGARRGEVVAAATSADAGGGSERTVGYIGAAFTA